MDYFAAVRAFLLAADLQSFSKAANDMAVKTSTVSRYVSELERDLGIALFNRSTRGLALTEGGRVFREHALVAVHALDEARRVTSSLNQRPQGVLRVTMPSAFGRRHIIPHLASFMTCYPDIDIDAVMTDDVLNVIDAGIDLAIRIGVLSDSLLMARRLASHRRIICASPDYVVRHGTPATPAELAEHEVLRFALVPDNKWMFVRRKPRAADAQHVSIEVRGRFRADDTEAVLDLALAGCGMALLPTWIIDDALRDGRLVQVLPEWEVGTSRADPAIWAVYPPKKTVSSKVRAFVDFYAAIFGDSAYWAT